ncbi:MAG: KilA-N domain-containing protein [Microcoleus sp.]
MSQVDFTALLTVSSSDRPDHVPANYIRVDHWGAKFNNERFENYEKASDNRRYSKSVTAKLCSISSKAQKPVIKPGQKYKGTGIWVHPLIASHYASWLNSDFAVVVNETFQRVLEGDSDLAADMMIRDHNKVRVDRAKNRVLCSETNKQTAAIAHMAGLHIGKVHNDRYNGLYRKTAAQLRGMAGIKDNETPLDVMSSRDLQMNGLANTLSLEAGDADLLFDFANDIKESYEKRMGKPLEPIFEDKLLRPNQARAIAYAPEYQTELPVLNC